MWQYCGWIGRNFNAVRLIILVVVLLIGLVLGHPVLADGGAPGGGHPMP